MDPIIVFWIILIIISVISVVLAIVVAIVGCTCLTPEKIMRIVFPYITKSGNHNVIYGFIIPKTSIVFHFFYMIFVVGYILFLILFNSFLTVSTEYNPDDRLDCFTLYNGSLLEVVSEEQAEMDNVTSIVCAGWKLDIGEGVGHIGGILTLSWVFVSIWLWIRLNLYHKAYNYRINGKRALGGCCTVVLYLFDLIFILCNGSASILLIIMYYQLLLSPISLTNSPLYNLPLYNLPVRAKEVLDIILLSIILQSGVAVFPSQKRAKTLTEHCKDAVEDPQEEQEGELEEIVNRLTRNGAQDPQRQVDHLVELGQMECKKALADTYYYNIAKLRNRDTRIFMTKRQMNIEEQKEEEMTTVNEKEMKKIAQVAYCRITQVSTSSSDSAARPDEGEQDSNQGTDEIRNRSTNDPSNEEMSSNTSTQEDETSNQGDKVIPVSQQ